LTKEGVNQMARKKLKMKMLMRMKGEKTMTRMRC
jgi:hypothetical protein